MSEENIEHLDLENAVSGIIVYMDDQGNVRMRSIGSPTIPELLGFAKYLELELPYLYRKGTRSLKDSET